MPVWLNYDASKKEATLKARPELANFETGMNFASVVEYYSRA